MRMKNACKSETYLAFLGATQRLQRVRSYQALKKRGLLKFFPQQRDLIAALPRKLT